MKYYYLVASLPMLFLGRPPPFSMERFRGLCREQLVRADLAVLDALLDREGAGSDHPFLSAWREREVRLRNAVARARAARTGREVAPYLRPAAGFDVYTEQAVAEAFRRGTPLEREMDLDRWRWNVLEELAAGQPFSLAAVLAYALKLRLVERWQTWSEEAGRARVEAWLRQPSVTESGVAAGAASA